MANTQRIADYISEVLEKLGGNTKNQGAWFTIIARSMPESTINLALQSTQDAVLGTRDGSRKKRGLLPVHSPVSYFSTIIRAEAKS